MSKRKKPETKVAQKPKATPDKTKPKENDKKVCSIFFLV